MVFEKNKWKRVKQKVDICQRYRKSKLLASLGWFKNELEGRLEAVVGSAWQTNVPDAIWLQEPRA